MPGTGGGCRWIEAGPRGSHERLVTSPRSGSLVLLALARWGCSGVPSPRRGAPGALSMLGQESPAPHPYPAPHPSLSSQPGAEQPGDEPALPPPSFPPSPCRSGGTPRALLGEPPGLLPAPHPSTFRAPCGRRKVSPPNKFRFNLQVKKSVLFCS